MTTFSINIEKATVENKNFRKVLFTAKHTQLVLMSLKPSEDIGMEKHDVDQFFRVEEGTGRAVVNGKVLNLTPGSIVIIKAGDNHNIMNSGRTDLKMYSLYSPPHHKDKTIHRTKAQARLSKEKFDGVITK